MEQYRVIPYPFSSDEPEPYVEEFNAIQLLSEMPAIAVRNWLGAWCGYVGISKSHRLYGKDPYDYYDEMPQPHGGITFHQHSPTYDFAIGMPNANLWWLGFDCAHYGDFCPHGSVLNTPAEYRNIDYVINNLHEMVEALIHDR